MTSRETNPELKEALKKKAMAYREKAERQANTISGEAFIPFSSRTKPFLFCDWH
jgi:hypothetical protein